MKKLIFLALFLVSPARAAESARTKLLDRFAVMISSHIARHDTHYAVFHGCVDWHSAVHGHWALLRINRAAGIRLVEAARSDADLSDDGLAQELALLKENPDFELPYGRSWLLRLAIEDDLWRDDQGIPRSDALRALADEAASSLLSFYQKYPPTPFAAEYENSSWALVQLHDYFKHRGDSADERRVDDWVADRLMKAGAAGFDADFGTPEFFSLFGNWAYAVAKTQPPAALAKFLARRPIADADIAPVQALMADPYKPHKKFVVQAHQLGQVWSRAWALKTLAAAPALSAADRARFSKAYQAHVEEGARQLDRYGDEYQVYGHWVPQFAVYALTDGESR